MATRWGVAPFPARPRPLRHSGFPTSMIAAFDTTISTPPATPFPTDPKTLESIDIANATPSPDNEREARKESYLAK